MKSAEEWTEYRDKMQVNLSWDNDRSEHLKEFADFIRLIQIDSWRHGMTDAAEIVHDEDLFQMSENILKSRDESKP